MIRLPRWIVASAAMLWLGYHLVLAALSLEDYREPAWMLLAMAMFITAATTSVLLYDGWGMPRLQALFNLVIVVAMIVITSSQLVVARENDYATWHISAIGALLTVTAVRQQRLFAALGLISLVLHVITWGGLPYIFESGLVGAAAMILVGLAASRGIGKAMEGTKEYLADARANLEAREAQSSAHQERVKLLQQTLAKTLPTLRLISTRRGKLNEAEREQVRLLEAELRDEIRGRDLLNDDLRRRVRGLRAKGIEVLLLDEGGLRELDDPEKERYRSAVLTELEKVEHGRVTVRTKPGEVWRVSIAAVRPGVQNPDLLIKI